MSAMATVVPTVPSPDDDATNVWVNQPTLSVLLEESRGETMNGTITCVGTGDVYTISTQSNGTQTLTFPAGSLPLEASTTYQWWVNVTNLTAVWVNTTYTFTTGTPARMSENTGWSAQELLLIGLLGIVILLVILFMAMEIINEKKPDPKRLLSMLIAVVILIIAMGFI